ncbi:MAG: hypothetical protein IT269_14275, partial [Saprospiraceae bacterium]|nr:hypothetical protein [Saprospiraceae bacterium]
MSKIALDRILENKKTKDRTLNLSNCNLLELPDGIKDLDWLTVLILWGNDHLTDLSPIENLKNLEQLLCHGTGITSLQSVSKLNKLQ